MFSTWFLVYSTCILHVHYTFSTTRSHVFCSTFTCFLQHVHTFSTTCSHVHYTFSHAFLYVPPKAHFGIRQFLIENYRRTAPTAPDRTLRCLTSVWAFFPSGFLPELRPFGQFYSGWLYEAVLAYKGMGIIVGDLYASLRTVCKHTNTPGRLYCSNMNMNESTRTQPENCTAATVFVFALLNMITNTNTNRRLRKRRP